MELEKKTILAQTCAEYDWSLKAIEVMPEHVHIFLEALPDDAPSSIVRTLKSISAVQYLPSLPKTEGAQVLGIQSSLWLRGCYYGSAGAITEESVKKYIENQKSNIGAPNEEKAKSRRHDCHCRYRAVHRCQYILRHQSAKTELTDTPDCSHLSSVHRVVFLFLAREIEALPPSSRRKSMRVF